MTIRETIIAEARSWIGTPYHHQAAALMEADGQSCYTRLMEAICPLCNARSELLRSHVIPEFLFRPLYDDKHRYSILSSGF